MKLKTIISAYLILISTISYSQIFSGKSTTVSFYSKTPAKDIEATTSTVVTLFNLKTKNIVFSINNTSFKFENELMQEHFNEKYMESEKYPRSTFSGIIQEDIDFTKDGEHKVSVKGKLNIHGVEVERIISGILTIKNNTFKIVSEFIVKLDDHKITVPSLVGAEIAKEIKITMISNYEPKK